MRKWIKELFTKKKDYQLVIKASFGIGYKMYQAKDLSDLVMQVSLKDLTRMLFVVDVHTRERWNIYDIGAHLLSKELQQING